MASSTWIQGFIISSIFFSLSVSQQDGSNFLLCYSCSSINASVIVGAAGVDPGVFLSTIPLATVPVTRRCMDPFDDNQAVRVGVSTDFCDSGLCVKMNFTHKVTGEVEVLRSCLPRSKGVFKETCTSFSSSQAFGNWCVCDGEMCNHSTRFHIDFVLDGDRCISCTTIDADKLIREIRDPDWQQWLTKVRDVPQSPYCALTDETSTRMLQAQQCDNGVCMKMTFNERRAAGSQVWRTCIPNGKGQIRADCSKIFTAAGDMEVCTCDGDVCNGSVHVKSCIIETIVCLILGLCSILVLHI